MAICLPCWLLPISPPSPPSSPPCSTSASSRRGFYSLHCSVQTHSRSGKTIPPISAAASHSPPGLPVNLRYSFHLHAQGLREWQEPHPSQRKIHRTLNFCKEAVDLSQKVVPIKDGPAFSRCRMRAASNSAWRSLGCHTAVVQLKYLWS